MDIISHDIVMNNADHVEYYYNVECNLVNKGNFFSKSWQVFEKF